MLQIVIDQATAIDPELMEAMRASQELGNAVINHLRNYNPLNPGVYCQGVLRATSIALRSPLYVLFEVVNKTIHILAITANSDIVTTILQRAR
jgi:hypothetical protein